MPHDGEKIWVVVGSCVNEDVPANTIWSALDLGRRREREGSGYRREEGIGREEGEELYRRRGEERKK